MSQFIGKGEVEAIKIFKVLFPKCFIKQQVPIQALIRPEEYNLLDQEIKNHKFDFTVQVGFNMLVVEINYKHGEKAAKKWSNIFTNVLINAGKIPVTIDDYNCEFLFKSEAAKKKNPWGPYIDIIRELQRQGISPNGSVL